MVTFGVRVSVYEFGEGAHYSVHSSMVMIQKQMRHMNIFLFLTLSHKHLYVNGILKAHVLKNTHFY